MTNTQRDPGIYPSDWKPPSTIADIQQTFEAHNFFDGRMIGGSKSHYHMEHPDDLIVFTQSDIVQPTTTSTDYGDDGQLMGDEGSYLKAIHFSEPFKAWFKK